MKKIVIIIGMLLVMAVLMPVSVWADGTQPPGSGTSGDPYQVSILDHLLWISTNSSSWGDCFEQTANIDATDTSSWNGGAGFSPIGDSTTQFTGSYDGQGHTITGLYINRPGTDYVGLFGYLGSGGSITNGGLMDAVITGENRVGALVGESIGTVVSSSSSSGAVSGDEYIGGLMGYNRGAASDSFAAGTVVGYNYVGGLVGRNYGSSAVISKCYATGAVMADNWYVGGLAGSSSSSATITNCYATGAANGSSHIGGLAGYNGANVSYCYSTGTVSGTTNKGGLIGVTGTGGSVSNCYWDNVTSGMTTSAGGTGKTTAEMQTQSTFTDAGWDFTDTWEMTEGVTYPLLQGLEGQPPIPEWPLIAVFSIGLLALAAFVVYKKRRAVPLAA